VAATEDTEATTADTVNDKRLMLDTLGEICLPSPKKKMKKFVQKEKKKK